VKAVFHFGGGVIGKKKTTTQQQQTNTYQYLTPPTTPAVTELQGMVQKGSDPSIPFHFAQQREDLANSYMNPLGAATSPAVRDAANRVAGQRLGMAEQEAIKASNFNANNQAFGQQSTIAGLTSPQLVQTGGTSSGTQTQSGGFWSGLLMQGINAGASVGAAAL
jgi:hypothetical protein